MVCHLIELVSIWTNLGYMSVSLSHLRNISLIRIDELTRKTLYNIQETDLSCLSHEKGLSCQRHRLIPAMPHSSGCCDLLNCLGFCSAWTIVSVYSCLTEGGDDSDLMTPKWSLIMGKRELAWHKYHSCTLRAHSNGCVTLFHLSFSHPRVIWWSSSLALCHL